MTPLEFVAAIRAHWIAADHERQRIRTHSETCWQWHAACALELLCADVERLTAQVREARMDADRQDWAARAARVRQEPPR